MSEQNPYDTLGITEAASFDEIQEARNRLTQQHESDLKQVETIEAAYDAILMERLRLRQEGKIKVPDRIRFPEESTTQSTPAKVVSVIPDNPPNWLQGFLDNPSREEILWPALAFICLGLLGFYYTSFALALSAGFNIYFLNRKEKRFVRAVLLTVVGLIVGIVVGLQLGNLLTPQGAEFAIDPNGSAAAFTCFLFWLMSSFLR